MYVHIKKFLFKTRRESIIKKKGGTVMFVLTLQFSVESLIYLPNDPLGILSTVTYC